MRGLFFWQVREPGLCIGPGLHFLLRPSWARFWNQLPVGANFAGSAGLSPLIKIHAQSPTLKSKTGIS